MTEKFDAIVVGAGPAGVTSAYVMAKSGMKILVIERGECPGSKNVIGGVLYVKTLHDLIPRFWTEAPLERMIVQHSYCLIGKNDSTMVTYKRARESETPKGYTILRSKFDRWYAKKAEDAGAILVNKTNVTELVSDGSKITGVRTDRGDVSSNLVVIAEGANAMLCEKAGLTKRAKPNQMAIAVKEIITLPSDRIQERFGLKDGEGAAIHYVGEPFEGLVGFGFLYTNLDSISVGFGAIVSTMTTEAAKPYDLIETFKAEPSVEPYIRDGQVKEYQAHMIPEGGYAGMPRLFSGGVLVVGDSAMLANPITGEGADLAVLSGRIAGEVATNSHRANDFSPSGLSKYQDLLNDSFPVRDMKKQSGLLRYIEKNLEIMQAYPEAFNAALGEWFDVDGASREEKIKKIRTIVTSRRSVTRMLKDAYVLGRKFL